METQVLAVFMIFCTLFCTTGNLYCRAAHNGSEVNIGVLLNYNSWVGKVAKTALEIAQDDINNDAQLLNGSRLVLLFRDTRGDAIVGAYAALDLLGKEVVAIIGPQASEVAEFILHLGDAAKVPIVSFSVTSPLVSNHRFPYFVRMAHSDALQMKPIAALAQAYGWRRVTVVYSDDEFRGGAVAALSDALRDIGSELEYRSIISLTADQVAIEEELYKLMTKESRVFVTYTQPDLCSKILMKAQEIGMMDSGYVWITTDEFTSLWDVVLNASSMEYMQGILGVKTYIQNSNRFGDLSRRWKRQFRLEYPNEEKADLNVYGSFAYDAVWMIAQAIGNLGNTSFTFRKPISSSPNFTQPKVFQEGPQLLTELLRTDFSGVSGVVQLNDGEIAGSTYEIANVMGNGYRVVGYWNNETQLSKQVPSGSISSLMSSPNNTIGDLKTVIWPGGSTEVPRGWEQPTSGKRLKIGVPIKEGFTEFVTVTFDSSLNRRIVTGFCIDVFEAVVKRLDYALPYDLIPYGDGDQTGYYDDLVYQVYLKNFDAVVGDITILANRSKYVDFTQPYTESGLVMVVPVKAEEANNAWAFMLPFTPGMWCTTGAFFIFTGSVIWVFEHRINPEFGGKPKHQVVTLLWFSFSTLVFSHREKLLSSLSRLVLIIWLFVVLILTSSYTASLTSILTVQKLNPAVKDVQSLQASGAPVGYQEGSFVGEYLREQLHIAKESLRTFSTPEEAGEILSNGTVDAIFDEIPYINIFLASQCGYTMVGPIYRTGGFGIVFPMGSPLLSDISRAVLSLSEDKEMQQIQTKWLNNTACTDSGEKVGSNRLSMSSFWGLYLITGSVSLVALTIFFSRLLWNYMRDPNVKNNNNSEVGDPSTGKSLKRAMKSFMVYVDQKESSAPSPETRVSEISLSQRNSQFSPENLTSCPSAPGTSPFSLSTPSRRSFSVVDDDHVVDVDVARASSVSAPDHLTEEFPSNTRR